MFVVLMVIASAGVTQSEAEETRRFLTADSSRGRIALIGYDGKTEWEHKIGPLHDLQYLPQGRVLFQTNWTRLVECDLESGRIVWEYDSATANGNNGKKIEVHAFERLANGRTLIAESGRGRLIEVDTAGAIAAEIPLQLAKPHPHTDTRLVRKTPADTYLVCHEGEGVVREYNARGEIVWEFAVPLFGQEPRGGHGPEAFGNKCFAALRLASGNTLISTGNGHSVIEVTPAKEIVWSVKQQELPGITLAWVTTLQVLPSGHIVLGNCHAGESQPQIIEINREKQVIWTFHDFQRFGNSLTNTQVLGVNGKSL
jgi:outer membrane protein assembly factor BamB